jgi:hypothetical protein
MRRVFIAAALLCVVLTALSVLHADEGMYPVTDLRGIDLRAKGLHLDVKDLYNPGGISQIDAIVNIGGCT